MNNNDIHLKSEKATNLIGTIPMVYLWTGLLTVSICIILLVVLFGKVKVPMYQEFEMKMLTPSSGYVINPDNLELEDSDIYKAAGGYCRLEKVCVNDTVFFKYKSSVIEEGHTPDFIIVLLPTAKRTLFEIVRNQASLSQEMERPKGRMQIP